jgi:hypothetical protein
MAASWNKANQASLLDEVRFLVFDRMTENRGSQRPGTGSLSQILWAPYRVLTSTSVQKFKRISLDISIQCNMILPWILLSTPNSTDLFTEMHTTCSILNLV